MGTVTLQIPVELDSVRSLIYLPLQTVLGSVADIKKSLAKAYPSAVVEVRGEGDVALASADESTTLGRVFTALYGLHKAASIELVELRRPNEGGTPCLGLQGQQGFIQLPDAKSFREYAFGPLRFKLSALSKESRQACGPALDKPRKTSAAAPVTISLLSQTGACFKVQAMSDWRVWDLKKCIQEREKVPAYRQRLIYAGRLLNDSYQLARYQLPINCTIHFVPRPDTGARQFAHMKKRLGDIDIEDPYRIQWAGSQGCQCEVWVSAHDTLGLVKYAMALVDPELAGKDPADVPEADMLIAQARRAACDRLSA